MCIYRCKEKGTISVLEHHMKIDGKRFLSYLKRQAVKINELEKFNYISFSLSYSLFFLGVCNLLDLSLFVYHKRTQRIHKKVRSTYINPKGAILDQQSALDKVFNQS